MHDSLYSGGTQNAKADAAIQAGIVDVQEILARVGLGAAERHFRVQTFRPEDLAPSAAFWAKAFDGVQPRSLSPLSAEPDLIVSATEEEFILCLREGLPTEQRIALLRHGAAHIALGHIRLGDRVMHADRLDQLQSRPVRRWDAQAVELLSQLGKTQPKVFAVQELTEALNRLLAGDLDPEITSALLLLLSYAEELVEVPEALSGRAQLFPHQKRGLAELAARLNRFNVAVLADSVGLGKTRLACALVRALKDTGRLSRAAIVTPRKLERNWRKEMAVVGLEEGDGVILVNKDLLKRWTPQESARTFRGCGLVIIEEAPRSFMRQEHRASMSFLIRKSISKPSEDSWGLWKLYVYPTSTRFGFSPENGTRNGGFLVRIVFFCSSAPSRQWQLFGSPCKECRRGQYVSARIYSVLKTTRRLLPAGWQGRTVSQKIR